MIKKVAFILPGVGLSGGIYVVFEHASRVNKSSNFEVYIITKNKILPESFSWHESAKELIWLTFDEAVAVKFDVVFATFWSTVFDFPILSSKHYAYFVQSIESRFYPKESKKFKEYVDSTYSLGLPIITEASWIKNYLISKYSNTPQLVKNGIRKDLYTEFGFSVSAREVGKLRVLVEGPLDVDFKNVRKTLELCKKSDADEVWLLTASDTTDCILADRVFSHIPITEVASIYRSCDVLIKLSYVEGMFGPPLEMFHCGGTAIVYNVSGHDEYIIDHVNGIVVNTDDESNVIKSINDLKHNFELLNSLKIGALNTALLWPDWGKASKEFEIAIENICNLPEANKKLLVKMIKKSQNHYRINAVKNLNKYITKIMKAISHLKNNFQKLKFNLKNKYFLHRFHGCKLSKSPLISVVIPIYDRTDALKASIDSILNQTYRHFELILVCDGSPEDTLKIVKSYEDNPKVRAFYYSDNSGNPVRGRNTGISEALGEYLAFQDSDDIADPKRLERSLCFSNKYNADVVYGGWIALVEDREIQLSNNQKIFSPDCDFEMLKEICVPCQSTVMARLDALREVGGLKAEMKYREDHELWLRLAYFGYKFKSIPHILTQLRLHKNNLELTFQNNDNKWKSLMLETYKIKNTLQKFFSL